jgi:hypothetical protein
LGTYKIIIKSMKNILNKPIKAKTLKKKLEKTLKITKGMKGYGLKKYKIEPFVKGTYIIGHCYDFKNNEIKTIFDDKPLQNNKPSIELIEKLDVIGIINDKELDFNNMTYRLLLMTSYKLNEVIEQLNTIKVRVNLLDEEDYE